MAKRREAGIYFCNVCEQMAQHYADTFRCINCHLAKTSANLKTPTGKARKHARSRVDNKRRRTEPKFRPSVILKDSRCSDKKYGRENDLTRTFIETAIARECSYCGDTERMMTLDRVDNAIGHIQSNVVAACNRCNYIRRDMPYEAWLLVAPTIRAARLRGLLDGWDAGCGRKSWKMNRTGSGLGC